MIKALPHRLRRDGRCRDCGIIDVTGAPQTCTRCALEIMAGRGHVTVEAPVRLFKIYEQELWRIACVDQTNGRLRADHFHLYVGMADGAPLAPVPDAIAEAAVGLATRGEAQRLAEGLTDRYRQVWVVTTVGSWNAVKTP